MLLDDEYSKFQLDLLYLIANADEAQNGLDLRYQLEKHYDERVNHPRVYQNLDTLVERDIVARRKQDDRENHYVLTDDGRERLVADLEARDFR